ncbi:calcium-transporting ATPase 1 [bacterium BMS3Abin10]|nr:calcium-transporting ATPase 1 [bacterium BMS3Abin10]GBE37529.1 calcium-transporting ATPase 1 [bacterium BMS3Bbin08]HDK16608.1 cation-translocating P-type ATPase [Nitrospirota bacterium]
MRWHALKEDKLLKELKVQPSIGLSRKDVEERLNKFGPNELQAVKGPSAFHIFIKQFKNALIIILLVATILSALVGEMFDAALILVIVIFSAGLGFLQEYRAEKAITALQKMLSPMITVLRAGISTKIPSKEVVPGDVLLIEAGDNVPADARVIKSHSMMLDEASLTGESVPVEKKTCVLPPETGLADRGNMIHTGTVVTYGRGTAVVVSTGMNTELGKIASEVGAMKEEKTPLEKRTEEIGKWLGVLSFGICFLVAGLGITKELIKGDITFHFVIGMVMFAVALAVAAVPEALAAIVTGTLAIGMREMAKRNALIRRMPAVETLGSVSVICSDKTGTITKGEMTVRKLFTGGEFIEVTGVGYEPAGTLSPEGIADHTSGLIRCGLLCNDSDMYHEEDRWHIKGDPTEGALIVLAGKTGIDIKDIKDKYPRIGEIPFSSERKIMTTIHSAGKGEKIAFMKGAPEMILTRCNRQLTGKEDKSLADIDKAGLLKVAESMAEKGLRVLAFAERSIKDETPEIESQMTFLGFAGMIDPPRREAIDAVRVCKDIGIKPVMITGDHKLTAMAVAGKTGIYREGDKVLTGAELHNMPDNEFNDIVRDVSVYSRVSPMDKLKIVRAWKNKGQIVAMTGDGVNDAPALKEADIGIAMGITGTEVTKQVADMILADDNFATIIKAIEKGRWIYDNIKKYLTYLLRANIVEVVVIGGLVVLKGAEYLPLLPAAILYINLITDGLPALALGVAPPEPDIMKRPPRDPQESVFSLEVKTFIFMSLLIESPLFFWIFLHSHDLPAARTKIFLLFVLIELVMALNFRSLRYSIFKAPPHKWLNLSVFLSVIITALVLLSPHVRDSFGIIMPGTGDFQIIIVIALIVTVSIEVTKAILKKMDK